LHAVSVGEVLSSVELLRSLRARIPGAPVFVSCSTLAGREAAEARLRDLADGIFYAPFDLTFAVRRVLRHIRPAALVVLETEIWPNLYRETKRSGAALVLVNGRISDKALPRYRRLPWFFRAVLALPDRILVQSTEDLQRYRDIGAPEARLTVSGNLKYDFDTATVQTPEPVRRWLGKSAAPLWVAASTVAPEFPGDVDEDDAVIEAFRQLPGVRLLAAPRKPERFDVAAAKLEAAGIRYARRSSLPEGSDADVLLLDSVGELAGVFPYATVVFMGGTLAHRGGHNILEPALFGKPVIVGPHLENFASIQERFRRGRGFAEIDSPADLATAVRRLIEEDGGLGARGKALAETERGATERAVQTIAETRWSAVPRRIPKVPMRALSAAWTLGGRAKRALTQTRRLSTPVISIGNLAMGGTGKTPVVRALARALRQQGLEPAVLTRGYGRAAGGDLTLLKAGQSAPVEITGDEAQMVLRDGHAHVAIGANRHAAGVAAEKAWKPDVFLLDDGFQHARLARDLDVVLLDGLDPFAGGWTFPAGRLREPIEALRRADLVVITRPEGRRFDGVLRQIPPGIPVEFSHTRPICWVEALTGNGLRLEALAGREVFAFCGIGNPDAFRATLEALGCRIVRFQVFPDHHRYQPRDVPQGPGVLVTTEKDAVKLMAGEFPNLYWLAVEAEIDTILKHINAKLRLGISS
jgi:tetraacyldisaccharide 4'-kinase